MIEAEPEVIEETVEEIVEKPIVEKAPVVEEAPTEPAKPSISYNDIDPMFGPPPEMKFTAKKPEEEPKEEKKKKGLFSIFSKKK